MNKATITLPRANADITVVLVEKPTGWVVSKAIDEDGDPVKLTPAEVEIVTHFAEQGVDETGV